MGFGGNKEESEERKQSFISDIKNLFGNMGAHKNQPGGAPVTAS